MADVDPLNQPYVNEIFEQYLRSPESVTAQWQQYFSQAGVELAEALPVVRALRTLYPQLFAGEAPIAAAGPVERVVYQADEKLLDAVAAAMAVVKAHRTHGHLAARLDPLGSDRPGDPALDPAQLSPPLAEEMFSQVPARVLRVALAGATFAEVLPELRRVYCGSSGYQIEHLASHEQRVWLRQAIETGAYHQPLAAAEQQKLLQRLAQVETFEQYLRRVFLGQKSFSIEGLDVMVPMLDLLTELAAADGVQELHVGMAHRGRLSVLAYLIGVPFADLLREFEGERALAAVGRTDLEREGMGDVKYHLGAAGTVDTPHGQVQVALASNPSHLEIVNPVVEGITRARQAQLRALAVLIHGDAAFPGQGSVAETFNLQRLGGYSVGGTVHLIANNQLGFTTDPQDSRSTQYASDLAKGFDCPVIHVNADDPEAALSAIRLAMAYRQRFEHDVVIDLVGYRRLGHNETDEPAYTQPQMYRQIAAHPTVASIYADQIDAQDKLAGAKKEAETVVKAAHEALKAEIAAVDTVSFDEEDAALTEPPAPSTAIAEGELRRLNSLLLKVPDGFTVHPKLAKQLAKRESALEEGGIEWAHAEALAFASLLEAGVGIRLTGQDAERGTFSQRHLVLHDAETGLKYTPLAEIGETTPFEVRNSPLSELAAVGFEYGFSVADPNALVLWEAQFGDFVNGAQMVVDQFIASGQSKWGQTSRLTLLLPHGYEGNGPEHSSARLERFLQLAAENNLRIVNATTAGQYFHLLRRQALDPIAKPLIVMTPKGLLRSTAAASALEELADGGFQAVIDDSRAHETVSRLILSTGKVHYDLAAAEKATDPRLALARLEQLYPFPVEDMRALLAGYPNLTEVVWTQEEPQNMGAWRTIRHRLEQVLPAGVQLRYAGRPWRSSPSEGYPTLHSTEQARLVEQALTF